MTTTFVPYRNPETGLPHHVQPEITKIPAPESLLFVGNSLFFFNNGVHRFVRKLLAGADPKVACRTNRHRDRRGESLLGTISKAFPVWTRSRPTRSRTTAQTAPSGASRRKNFGTP